MGGEGESPRNFSTQTLSVAMTVLGTWKDVTVRKRLLTVSLYMLILLYERSIAVLRIQKSVTAADCPVSVLPGRYVQELRISVKFD